MKLDMQTGVTGALVRGLRAGLVLGAVTILLACGGDGDSSLAPPPFGGTGTGGEGGGGSGGGGTTATASDLVLTLSAASISNDGSQTVLATAMALDGNRNTLANVPVTIVPDSNAVATPSGPQTDENGIVTAAIGVGSDSSNRTITVTAKTGAITRSASLEVRDPTGGGGTGPTLEAAISSPLITAAAPATGSFTVRAANGSPVVGVVVSVSTGRGNLAQLSASSVLTNGAGVATVGLQANSDGLTGADELIAALTLSGVQVSGRVGFTVTGATPTLSLAASASTLRASAGPVTVNATVRDSKGAALGNQVVNFGAVNETVKFSATTALTNAGGVATVQVEPLNPSVSSAEILQAATSVAGKALQSQLSVQIVGEAPAITLTLSSSNVTQAQPATARAAVKDLTGAPAKNAIVSFASQFGLVAFDATTAVTDTNGVASVVVSPKTAATAGGDVILASVTLGGVAAASQGAVQVRSTTSSGTPVLQLGLSSSSISAASPATVTATLKDARGAAAPGQVITFAVPRGLAKTNVATALTNTEGRAVVVLSPTSSSAAGADEVQATATYAGASLQATQGFQVQATNVTITDFDAPPEHVPPLSAYAQTPLTVTLTGASVTSPVKMSVTSSCVAQGKATLSPSSFSTTANTFTIQYRDEGCGAIQKADQLQVVVDGTATSRALSLDIAAPAAASLAFVQASPEAIYLKGSGFTESSIVTFEVRDAAGNALPGRVVELRLQTGAGGVTMEGRGVESVEPPSANPFTQTSNATGSVSVRVNSGTQPTPVRVHAKLRGTTIATVSSNLSVGIGLPSQLNFSLSQGTRNIEGYNIDGTPNTYQIIAADRSGNPVPAGTSINFVTEGGQVEAIRQTQLVNGIARTTANFVSSEPRPVDGRVTVTAYALGEESFIDLDGNNARDPTDPFQDLGNVFKDRNFDGVYDAAVDEYVPLTINNGAACAPITNDLLRLDASIPSVPGTCSGTWSGAGQVYVRRATETVLSTSGARPLWADTRGLSDSCSKITLQTGPKATQTAQFTRVAGDTWYGDRSGTLSFIIADANPGLASIGQLPRLNPMAAESTISATSPTTGLMVQMGGGSPVASTTEATLASLSYDFTEPGVTTGVILITLRSPSGTGTTVSVPVVVGNRPSACP